MIESFQQQQRLQQRSLPLHRMYSSNALRICAESNRGVQSVRGGSLGISFNVKLCVSCSVAGLHGGASLVSYKCFNDNNRSERFQTAVTRESRFENRALREEGFQKICPTKITATQYNSAIIILVITQVSKSIITPAILFVLSCMYTDIHKEYHLLYHSRNSTDASLD